MSIRSWIFFWLILLNLPSVFSQDSLSKVTVFSRTEFLNKILAHHPLAKQAQLLSERARMEIRIARGGFDPSLNYHLSEKQYTGSTYYLNRDGFLKIPIWPGAELKAGYEQNSGQFLNASDKTPAEGLLYAGISLPVGQYKQINPNNFRFFFHLCSQHHFLLTRWNRFMKSC